MSLSLPHAVGLNVRRIREEHGVSQQTLALHMRDHGVKWSPSRVAELESGKHALSASNLLVLAQALGDATYSDVALSDLLSAEEPVQLTDRLTTSSEALQYAMRGLPVELADPDALSGLPLERLDVSIALLRTYRARMAEYGASRTGVDRVFTDGLSERRVARRLGIGIDELARMSVRLWGKPFAAHRDAVAGEGASAQKRGFVTKTLLAELQAILEAEKEK